MAGDPRQLLTLSDTRKQFRGDVSGSTGRGVVYATPQTQPGVDTSIPGFLSDFMEPYVQRKQTESFYAGMAKQMEVGATSEIQDDGNHLLTELWGPSHFIQGRAAFQAKTAVNQVMQDLQTDPELKKLSSDDLAAHVSKKMQGMLTGNEWTDPLIQKDMVEQVGPFMNTVAKERFAWQQNEAVIAQTNAIISSGDVLQSLKSKQAAVGTPESDAATLQEENFVGMLIPPVGRNEALHIKTLGVAINSMAEKGNFYAVEAMRKRGILNLLSPADAEKFEKTYDTQANQTFNKLIGTFNPEILALTMAMETGFIKDEATGKMRPFSPAEVQAEYTKLNARARSITGIDGDMFKPDDILKGGVSMVKAIVSRAEEASRALRTAGATQEAKDKEAQGRVSGAIAAVETGQIRNALEYNLTEPADVSRIMFDAAKRRDMGPLVKGVLMSNWHSESTAQQMQSGIKSSVAAGVWSDSANYAYEDWKQMNNLPGGAAAAMLYYGQYNVPMTAMHNLVTSAHMDPRVAFASTFGDASMLDKYALSFDDRKAFNPVIKKAVEKLANTEWLDDDDNLNNSAQGVFSRAVEQQVGIMMKFNKGLNPEDVTAAAVKAVKAGGLVEHYGSLAWSNPKVGGPPLIAGTGMQAKEFGKVLNRVVDDKLKATGRKGGLQEGSFSVTRTGDNLQVQVTDADGDTDFVPVSKNDIVNFNKRLIYLGQHTGWEVRKVKRVPGPTGPNNTIEYKTRWKGTEEDNPLLNTPLSGFGPS